RARGVVLASIIAPIFLDTFRDAGGLPVQVDVARISTGDEIEVRPLAGEVLKGGEVVARFQLKSAMIADEYRAGGRTNLIIGRALTARARQYLKLGDSALFRTPSTAQ